MPSFTELSHKVHTRRMGTNAQLIGFPKRAICVRIGASGPTSDTKAAGAPQREAASIGDAVVGLFRNRV